MARSSAGPMLVAAGAVVILVGLLVWAGAISWFGRLPGDIRIERPNARLYIPITSMVLLSIVLSVLAMIIRRWR
ncbi:MAG: DUF2905 domain-containing protein [Gemmatimonadaceae bacterium]